MLARTLLVAGLVGLFAPAAPADVKVHPLFADHAVLQRGVDVPVWGTAEAGEKVTVTLTDGEKSTVAEATADDKGAWKATLSKRPAGTGLTLTVAGKNTVKFTDVAVGDVWVCSGQSNMEWKVQQLTKDEAGKQLAAKAANANIRLFDVPNRPTTEPQRDFPVTKTSGLWLECKPDTVLNFSAVGYVFGRDIQESQKVPVGLISSDWGGTPAEAWTSKEALAAEPVTKHYADKVEATIKNFDPAKAQAAYEAAMTKWKADADEAKKAGKPAPRQPQKPGPSGINQNSPAALYNGMIAPLLPFPIKGAIWYQGESNAGRAHEYRTLMPTLIKDWRAKWGTDLPFFIVQLAPFRADGSEKVSYAELRDAQYHTTTVLPKVGLAVITDVGDETDIHPQRKEPVGQRLALAARALAYDEKIEYSGPVFKAQSVEGDKIVLTFTHVGKGLDAKGSDLTGFTVCGEDKVFHPAKAEIKGDTVVVSSDKVAKPTFARFGWVNFAKPELNFVNKDGLPAVPFRTDDFPLTTAPKK